MKPILRLSLVLVIALVSLVGTAVLAQDDEPLQPILGAINIIDPNLYMTPAGGEEEMLRSVSVFDAGETLRSDENGVALITFFYDGTEAVLGPNGRLTLNAFSGEASDNDYVVDLELHAGHLIAGLGGVANMASEGNWTLTTPAFKIKLLRGQFEVTVTEEGTATLVVTEGRVEVMVGDAEAITIDENQVFTGGEPQTLSDDGVVTSLEGVCTATPTTQVRVRLAPNTESRQLGSVTEDQALWVRAGTEGNLWLQIYFQTAADDEEGHNFGWVYGPAVTLAETGCDAILHAPLDAEIYGGLGVDESPGAAGESEPLD